MATASDIGANFSNYRGDEALGGGTLGAFKLDTGPLQDFARFTMLYNRAEYDQRQKDAEKAANELAKIADYDLTTSIQKDAKVLQEKYDKLTNYVKQNPNALQYNKNKDQWLEYQRLKNDLSNDIRGAKVRNLTNVVRQNEVSQATDEADKKRLAEDLAKEIDATDIRTPLKFTQQYDTAIPDFGANKGQSITVNKWLGNQITQDTSEFFDAAEAKRQGLGYALGVDFDTSTKTGQLKQQKYQNNFYVKGAELLNQAVQNAATGIDPTLSDADKELAIKSKLSGIGMMKNIDAYNNYMAQKQKEIAANVYTDRNRKKLDPADYQPINWADGLSPEELYAVVSFTNWAGDKQDTKIIQTNDAIERARIGLGYANLALQKDEFKMKKDQYEEAIKGTEMEKNAALAFAQNLFTDLGSLASRKTKEGGFLLSNDDVRKLTTDQLKYLGLETPPKRDEDGKVIESGGLNPLQLGANDILSVDPNGTVRVMKDAKYNSAKDRWEGEWDNTRSTSIWNAATNRLNEENIKSAGKERNAYLPIDLRGKEGVIQVDVSGGETKTKTTNSTSEKQLSENPADWKREGNNWRYKDGTLYNSKGEVIKQ